MNKEQMLEVIKDKMLALPADKAFLHQCYSQIELYATGWQVLDINAYLHNAEKCGHSVGAILINIAADSAACKDIANGDHLKTLRCDHWRDTKRRPKCESKT